MYSEIYNKEIFATYFKKDDQIYIYTKNFYMKNGIKFIQYDLIEFILPIENIEGNSKY